MQNEEFIQGMNQLGQQLGMNNQLLIQNVQQMIQKAERESRKKRKKKMGEQLLVTGDSYLGVNRYFDDGSNEFLQLSYTLMGEHSIYTLDFQGVENTEKFGIYFTKQGIWVIGDKKKVKPEYLFDCFVKASGTFNPVISRSVAGKLLYNYWAARIEQTENRVTVPILAGWHEGKFLYWGNYMYRKTKDFPDVPVFHKKFMPVALTDKIIQIYFDEFLQIPDERERFLIVLYPFLGIISSIYNSLQVQIEFCLNFIVTEFANYKKLCSWFKVFNRDCLFPCSLDITDKELNRLITTSNDEILICDAVTGADSGNYKVQKIRRNAGKVIEGMKRHGGVINDQEMRGCYACVLISDGRIIRPGVQNILWEESTVMNDNNHLLFTEFQVMEAILSDFISYVERNMELVWELIIKRRDGIDRKSRALVSIYEIVKAYWQRHGIDFQKELKITGEPERNSILRGNESIDVEILESFKEAIRKGAKFYVMAEKRRNAKYDGNTIYYTQEFLYVPTRIIRSILDECKLSAYIKEILLILKEKQELVPDPEGYSHKIHISSHPVEVYKIRKEFFNDIGMVDVVQLGKEGI